MAVSVVVLADLLEKMPKEDNVWVDQDGVTLRFENGSSIKLGGKPETLD